MKYYNRTNTCDRCGISFEKASGNPYREYNKDGYWTGRWLCLNCYKKDYDRRPNCGHSLEKEMTDRRIGNQDPYSSNAKGDMFEELTCIWRGVKNLNIENDNYKWSIDHSRDPELGIIQTRGRFYDHINRCWTQNWEDEHNKEFDNLIFYCASKDGENIERIYIFPKKEIIKRRCLTIVKNPSRGVQWYEKYRVKDEELLRMVNDIWRDIIKRKRIKKDV